LGDRLLPAEPEWAADPYPIQDAAIDEGAPASDARDRLAAL
jgi:hypothetical protein